MEIMNVKSFLTIGILALLPLAYAQNNSQPNDPDAKNSKKEDSDKNGDKETRNGFWEANLKGGNYMVALGAISSVSRHNYVLDGVVIVDEVTVDTSGEALVRFYFISPIELGGTGAAASDALERIGAIADGALRRGGTDVQDMVVKKYPLTTHTKTIEYRLLSAEQLGALYSSVKTAWVTGKGRIFTGG